MMFPPGSSDEPKVDLCLCSSGGSDAYVFNSTKYFGEKSLNDIHRDLLLSAKHGGFNLMTQSCSVSKVAAGVKKRLVLACTRSTCYKGAKVADAECDDAVLRPDISVHGTICTTKKLYNNVDSSCPDVQVRKTKTVHPVEEDRKCPFQITVELRQDDLWYLSKPRRHSAKAELLCLHKWHPKCEKEHMSNISTRYMSQEEKDELARFQSSHISMSVSAHLISSVSDFRWLPSQVQYCSSRENEFLNQIGGNLSSADQLLAYFRSRDDVSFVVLKDTSDGLVVTSTKGKQRTPMVSTISSGPVFDRYLSTFDGDNKKKSLRLTDDQSLLLAVAWVTDDELMLLEMFPEVWFMDVTSGTNKEGRGLFLVAGKDSNNNGFTRVRIFLPSEQLWVFDWIFRDCLPSLIGVDIIKRNKLCLTDGDPQMYGALRAQQMRKDIWQGEHALCEWHLLVVGWHENVIKHIPEDDKSQWFGTTAYKWIQSWFWYIDTIEEFEESLTKFWKWLEATDDNDDTFSISKNKVRDFVTKSLLPKRDFWLRPLRLQQLSFDAKTTSVVEQQNHALKRGVMAVKGNCTIQKAAEVMNDNSRVTHSLKKIKRAKDISSTPLWTSSGTRLALTSFAEMIVSTNLDKSRGYVAVQTSATAWSIIHKSHLGCSLGPYHVEGTPIPRFRRVYKVTLHFNKYLCCNCHFFSRMLLPCCHMLHIVGDVSSNMCHIRWHKSYMFHYERQDEVSGTLKELAKFIPIGVPVEGTTFVLDLLSSENNSFPCKVQGISDENYETFITINEY